MDPRCAAAVRAAAHGRPISDAKLALIEQTLDRHMRQLAKLDRQRWLSLTRDQRMTEATQAAMAEIAAESARKVHNAELQVLRAFEREQSMQASMAAGMTKSQAVIAEIEQTGRETKAVQQETIAQLGDTIEAVSDKQGAGLGRRLAMFLFDVDNPGMTANVVREIFAGADGSTGNKLAQAGARAWLDTIEAMRLRFNAAGGAIGKLGYGYLSQAHDSWKVLKAGADRWADFVLPRLDREQYLRTDGSRMDDAEVRDLLLSAHETIATEGANKTPPGQFNGTGARANRGSDHRVLHFKDGDSWMQYMAEFGHGSLYDAMMGHVAGMARNIALVERHGPNPNAWFKLQNDLAGRADLHGRLGDLVAGRSFGNAPQAYWDIATGNTGAPENRQLAFWGQSLRNVQTAAKITWGPFSALADVGTIAQTLHFHRIPIFEYLAEYKRGLSGEHRDFLRSQAIIGQSVMNDLNRWTGDHMTHSLTGHIANSVMKISLMNAWTDAGRNAFAAVMMHNFARKAGTAWDQLDGWDRHLMGKAGIGPDEWAIITQAKPVEHEGAQYLSGNAIRSVSDAEVTAARPAELAAISARIQQQTAELSARNAQERSWIRGRIDKFDDARDSLNRWVKGRLAKRLKENEDAAGPMLQRMALLDAQIEQAKLQADMEADFNRFATQDEMRRFLNAVEDGASADLTDVGGAFGRGGAKSEVRQGLESAETIGRRYGEAKGRLERRMHEIENRIAEMDRQAVSAANADAKVAQKKADDMAADLRAFVKRSQDRQARRQFVIDRVMAEEQPRLAAEAERLRSQAATKWLAFVLDEAEYAVVNPDMATRAVVTGGGAQAGTPMGEVMRSAWQFKSFPMAMLSRHWRRAFDTPAGIEGAPAMYGSNSTALNRVAALAALGVTTTMLGALQTQSRALLSGKDPIDMDPSEELGRKFWAKSFAAGGGAGFLADVAQAASDDPSRRWQGHLGIFGPVAGAAGGLIDVAKSKHKGADALGWVSDQAPFVDMWQTRAAYEHWFLHNAQEMLNPGYLGRMQRRAQQQWGQGYWWTPGEALPDRAPDFERAVGQ